MDTPNTYAGCLALLGFSGPLVKQARQLARTAVAALAYLPTDGRTVDEFAPDVLAVFEAVPVHHRHRLFAELDEKPGAYGYEYDGREWHWKLRRVRNHQTHGRALFAALAGDES